MESGAGPLPECRKQAVDYPHLSSTNSCWVFIPVSRYSKRDWPLLSSKLTLAQFIPETFYGLGHTKTPMR